MNSQLKGTQVAGCLNPVRGVRDQQRRKGVAPVDYAKKNLQFIRDVERRQQQHKDAVALAAETKPVPFKLKQFANVSSRLRQASPSPNQQENPDQSQRKKFAYLKKGQRLKPEEPAGPASVRKPRVRLKEAVPRRSDVNELAPRNRKNFISSNFREAKEAKSPACVPTTKATPSSKHKEFGKVPKYLVRQKVEQARKDLALREAEAMGVVPQGMVVMKEEDRLRTLATLKDTAEQAKKDIQKAPLRIETPGQRRRMKELEDKLKETEEAIQIFSKERVYVYEE